MKAFDIQKDEYGKVLLTWLMSALLALGYTIGWSAVHSMLVKRMGVEFLPYTYIGISLLGIFGSSVYLMFADTVRRDRLLIAFSALTALMLALSRLLVESRHAGDAAITPELVLFFGVVLFAQGIGNSTLGTQVWTIIGDVFRPSQGRRLYPIIGTSGTIGGILGGLSINVLVENLGAANLVLVWAIAIGGLVPLTIIFQLRYGAELKGGARAPGKKPQESKLANLKEGWRYFLTSPLIRVISAIAIMFWVVGSLQDFQYTRIMNNTFQSEEALARYYGYYGIAFNISAMIIQFGLAPYILKYFGVGRGLSVLPLTILAGFAGLQASFTFLPGLAMRYAWDIIGMTIQGNTFHLALNSIPSNIRGRVRGFIYGVVNPLGGVIGGVLILALRLPFQGTGGLAVDIITLAGLAISTLWFLASLRVKKVYMDAVVENLGNPDHRTFLDAIECLEERSDQRAAAKLMEVLCSSDQEARSTAMLTLARLSHLPALRHISRMLKMPDEAARKDAVQAIRQFREIGKHPFLATYFKERMQSIFSNDPSRDVRAEAARFLIERRKPEDIPHFVDELLRSGDATVKAKVVETLMELDIGYADFALERLYDDPDPSLRAALAVALWPIEGRREDALQIMRALLGGEQAAERLAGLRCIVKTGCGDILLPEQALRDDNPQVRALAALAALAATPSGPLADEAVAILLDHALDPAGAQAFQRDILPLLPALGEDALDGLFVEALMLPLGPGRDAVIELFKGFHDVFERSMEGLN
jgi:AAA family ATP:ADP antiporter